MQTEILAKMLRMYYSQKSNIQYKIETKVEILNEDAICLNKMTDCQETAQYLRKIWNEDVSIYESFYVLFLNQGNRILRHKCVSIGAITGTVLDIRLILRDAINTPSCTSIILAHNHPSGRMFPSDKDILLTKKMKEAAKIMDITVVDHIILSPFKDDYYSFVENGQI